MTKLRWIILGLVIGFGGCATQKPQMPDSQYYGFAKAWHTIGWCAYKGWMDADTAARGKTYVATTMNQYSFDRERMDRESRSSTVAAALDQVTEGDCRNAAVSIQGRKQQIDNQNATAAIQQQETQNMINATKSTKTYCNKIGTQVLCNSF